MSATDESLTAVKQTPWQAARNELLDAQGGLCAICRKPLARHEAHLDHCHASGFLRGALCVACNVQLGWYEANASAVDVYLRRAKRYAATARRRATVSHRGKLLQALRSGDS